ncbi:hypothetical protein M0R45_018167 [Rubus argutus]|uniref:Uncharacterized protein n=1 Tax=Rubus argutus TaxID=59490 RepID=A0AAW1X339_RUBAR
MAESIRSESSDHIVIDVGGGKRACIFRVPKVLRRQKSEAYTPDVVSIGPFHYRAPEKLAKRNDEGREDDFQLMERVKRSYLDEVLSGMKKMTLEELIAKVTELSDQKNEGGFEERARGFYAEPLAEHITSKPFIEMMIVDGCFLIQLFRKCNDLKLQHLDDPVFNMDCMFHFLCHDILLLENQLPWFVLTTLYRLTHHKYAHEPSLSILILKAFTKLPSLKQCCSSYIKHLTDNPHKFRCDDDDGSLHVLDLIRASIVVPQHKSDSKAVHDASDDIFDPDQHQMRTATALSKADIKFRKHKNHKKDKRNEQDWEESIMNIRFDKGWFWRNGFLTIPQLNVGILSLTLFRNLIAIEQCYHGYSNEITSYAILMDNLISSHEDMELLRKAEVIGNWLSDEDGCNFFNNLHKDVPHNNFYYKDLCDQVHKRYKLRRYTWLALLKIENFSNPWKILAFGFAIVAVILSSWASIFNILRFFQK